MNFNPNRINKAWQELIDAMLSSSDKSSDADMDVFNSNAKVINNAMSWFKSYHETKRT